MVWGECNLSVHPIGSWLSWGKLIGRVGDYCLSKMAMPQFVAVYKYVLIVCGWGMLMMCGNCCYTGLCFIFHFPDYGYDEQVYCFADGVKIKEQRGVPMSSISGLISGGVCWEHWDVCASRRASQGVHKVSSPSRCTFSLSLSLSLGQTQR